MMSEHRSSDIFAQRLLSGLGLAGMAILAVLLLSKPSPFLTRMRFFSKRVINPVVLRFAGAARSPFAAIRHVGRRSGKVYTTPLLLAPVAGGFVIELTYGFEVDWYRNVRAAGQCTLLWQGREYTCTRFETLDAATALPAFPPVLRLPLRAFGAQHFVRMM
ncbi:MAG: hypothetical protein NVS2B12_33790 [Ktedonobacteraceae bacterium]